MKSTAALLTETGGDFTLAEVHVEEPRTDEVLVEIRAVGLCHTDLAARDGVLPIPFPGVVGHEGAGVVLAVGDRVGKVAIGDRVAVTFNSCGQCTTCARGERSYCENFMVKNYAGAREDGSHPLTREGKPISSNFFGQSSFATVALANEQNVVKIDDEIPFELLAPLGCGIQTGFGAVTRSLQATPGSSLAIAGGGSVGLSAVLGGVYAECETIIVIEPHAARRELALELGATHAIDPSEGDVAEQIRAITPRGVDAAIDTSGLPAVLESLVAASAAHGKLGLIGVPRDPAAALSLNLIMTMSVGLTVKGIVEGDSDPDAFIPELVALYCAGRLPLDKLVTTYPFANINDAVADQHAGKVVKPVLMLQ